MEIRDWSLETRQAPGTSGGHILWKDLPAFWNNPLELCSRLVRQHGDLVRLRFGRFPVYLVAGAEMIKHILQDNNRNYVKDRRLVRLVNLAGESLFAMDGDTWLSQRRIMQPAFHRQRLADFGDMIASQAEATVQRWLAWGDRPIEVEEEMMNLTMNVVGRVLFSVDMSGEARHLRQSFTTTSSYITFRLRRPFYPPLFVPTRANRRFKAAIETIRQAVLTIIQERQGTDRRPNDLLTMMMEARYEDTGEGMGEEQLINEMSVMVFAGHETTADALTWTLYLLDQNREARCKLEAELAAVLGGRTPNVHDLPNLPYNRMVIEEAMRLYPPAWIIPRQAVARDQLGPYPVPADALIFVAVHAVHRRPEYWDNPECFEPERFTPERSADRPKFVHLPFGGGPRQCIGANLAMLEAQLVLATIAQRVRLSLVPGHRVEPFPVFALRTRYGLPMTAQLIQ